MTGTIENLVPLNFAQLANWKDDDHLAAFNAFVQTAKRAVEKPYSTKGLGVDSGALSYISRCAQKANIKTAVQARQFFETHFSPCFLGNGSGHLTAYYEPVIKASRFPSAEFNFPILARPKNLIDIDDNNRPSHFSPDMRFAKQNDDGSISPYYTRAQIEGDDKHQGVLAGKGLEIAYVADPMDAYFIHIQGSARLELTDGSQMAVTYAAKAGHKYQSIGKRMVEIGELTKDNVSMTALRNWFAKHPTRRTEITWHNPSYIFFEEIEVSNEHLGPVAAAKVQLTPGRSLAVDRLLHTYGCPIWIEIENAPADLEGEPNRLMIAQDTGSAIVGAARGDLFIGSGEAAGLLAGDINHQARFVVFVPKSKVST